MRMAGFLSGFLVSVVLVLILLKWTRKDRGRKCKYDERQEIVRGRGFKYGFFTMAVCNILYGILDMTIERKVIDTFAAIFICVAAGMLAYIGYCIWNEGYFALNENPKRLMVVFTILALANFGLFAIQLSHGEVIKNGVLTASSINLWCAIEFFGIFVIMFVKKLHDKREAE